MRVPSRLLIAAGLATAASPILAFEPIVVESFRNVVLTENRRNPGEMSSLASGDLDGDGFADLVLGAPRASGFQTVESGMVYARFGADYYRSLSPAQDSGGLYYDFTAPPNAVANPLNSAVTLPDSLGRQPSGVQIAPERGGEAFGTTVAVGDFNGDNFADVAISAPNPFGTPKLGTVYLVYGRADMAGIRPVEGEIFDNNAIEIRGREAGARFGETLFFADIDNDGFDDLVIGTPRAGIGGIVDVLYGQSTAITGRTTIDTFPGASTSILSSVADEALGSAGAAGDLTGDGIPELCLGAPSWPTVGSSRGRVVALNFAGTRPPVVDLSIVTPLLTVEGTENGAGVGEAVEVGDFDGDSIQDLVMGAPRANPLLLLDAGVVYVLSNPSAFAGGTAQVPANESLIIRGVQVAQFFGSSLLMANFDGSTGEDLIVGSPGWDASSFNQDGGAAYIYRTGSLPIGTVDAEDPNYPIGRVQTNKPGFRLGTHLAAGNFDGRFREDLFIAGDGTYPFAPSCGSGDQSSYENCHATRQGIRVWGLLSRLTPVPPGGLSTKSSWLEAE